MVAAVEADAPSREVVVRGPMADKLYLPFVERRWTDIDKELGFWGGAGTGKSFSLLLILVLMMLDDEIKDLRIMWCRKTRASITQSSIVTFSKVLKALGMEMSAKPQPSHRQEEVFHTAAGTNTLVWKSLEDPLSAFSAEYDIVVFEEAIQVGEAVYELASGRCLRNKAIPRQFIIALTNPGPKVGWLYRRMFGKNPQLTSCQTTIKHNPAYWDIERNDYTPDGLDYVDTLQHTYTGTRRLRLLHGEWVSEEGWALDGFDEKRHTFEGQFTVAAYSAPRLTIIGDHPDLPAVVEIEWTFGSMDLGWQNAGTLQAWAVDKDGRLFLLEEVYHSKKDRDWWAEHIVRMSERYKFEAIVADHAPEVHDSWNTTIRERLPKQARTRDGQPYLRKCAKSRGEKDALKVDVVRTLLHEAPDGKPRCYLNRKSRKHRPDPILEAAGKPTSLHEEVPQIVWKALDDTKVDDKLPEEKLHEGRANHGFDGWVYAGRFARDRNERPEWEESKPELYPGSWEYDEMMREKRMREAI